MNSNFFKSLLVLVLAIGLVSFTYEDKSTAFKVRTDKSELIWNAYKVGGGHTGTIKLKSGSFQIENDLITSGTFVIDMNSFKVTDSESSKLYSHIRSQDFFNMDQYPTATLVITGSVKKEEDLVVSGNLTILDKTNPITFTAKSLAKTDNFRIYTANIIVDRTKYNIVYRSSAVGDTFIKDEFDLNVKITAEKN